MADVLLSNTCLIGALGTCSIGMLRTELLSRKDERLFDGYRVFKVVHLKEKTLIGHEFFAVYLRKWNTFIVVRIERRPGSPLGSSSDLWTDDSISRLNSNFDFRGYYHLSTTFCSSEKALTVLGMCDICAFIRHAAPFYSITKQKHCYWFCAAFLIRLSTLGYSTTTSLEKGKDHYKGGRIAWKQLITEEHVSQELAARAAQQHQHGHVRSHLLQFFPTWFRSNREQWELEWELKGHTHIVHSVCFTPDGKHLLSSAGSLDCTIRTWDIHSGKDARRPLAGDGRDVRSLAVSPDGRYFVWASENFTVHVWDLEAGTPASEPFRGHDRTVTSVAFSPDGHKIVSGSYDHSLRIWDTETGETIGEPLLGHRDWVYSVAWSPDGSHIVSGSDDQTVRMWNAQTGAPVGEPLLGHTRSVMSVCFSPDGCRIVSGSEDETVRIWDTASGQAVGEPLCGHTGWVYSVAFSPDGRWIASGSRDNTVHIWESTSGGEIVRLNAVSEAKSVAWSPTGEHIAAGCRDGMVRVWCKTSAKSNSLYQTFSTSLSRIMPFHTPSMQWTSINDLDRGMLGSFLGFTPDGQYILFNNADGITHKWDVTTGKEDRQLAVPVALAAYPKGRVGLITVALDGRRIATITDYSVMNVWELESGRIAKEVSRAHAGSVTSAAFSPNGSRIVVTRAVWSNSLEIWDANTGTDIGTSLQKHEEAIESLAWSPDGSHIISGSRDRTIRVWDAQTWAPIGEPLLGHTEPVNSVSFSPDGSRFVSGSEDGTIRLWDTTRRRPVGEPLRGHSRSVRSVAFSPDGRWIVSGSLDKTVRIWSIKSGRADGEVARLDVQSEVWSVAWSGLAGDVVAAGCDDEKIGLWRIKV